MVRIATVDDVPEIARVWGAAWLDGHRGNVPQELLAERTPDYFAGKAADWADSALVAEDDDRLLGVVVVIADELVQLAVAVDARGRGVGAALLTAAEDRIREHHDRAWLAVVPGNMTARRLYERNGWRDAGSMTYDAPTSTGGTIPVPVRRYIKTTM